MEPAAGVTPDLFWETMTAFQKSAALKAAVDLEIVTHIGAGKGSLRQIRSVEVCIRQQRAVEPRASCRN